MILRAIILLAVYCGLSVPLMAEPVEDPDLEQLLNALQAAPAWTYMSVGKVPQDGPALMIAIRKCAVLNEADLRTLVVRLLAINHGNKPGQLENEAWSKIFVLNRYYFAVPSTMPRKYVTYFGGWGGVPTDGKTVNMFWPLEQAADGTIKLVGASGGYMGPPYRALDEFDFYAAKYGARFPQKTVEKPKQ